MRAIELERTFLARTIPPEIRNVTPVYILDVYVPEHVETPYIRLRQKGNDFFIIKKVPIDGDASRHYEDDIALSAEEFAALRGNSQRTVSKNRYFVSINGVEAQVDIFDGVYAGLVIIDFEFTSEAAKNVFLQPDYCLIEVTDERFVAGGQLAGRGYDDIVNDLQRFNYRKLKI